MDKLIDVVASGFAIVTVISLVFVSLHILIFIELGSILKALKNK
jgi:hypothetical protein